MNIENLSPGTIRVIIGAVLIVGGIAVMNVYSPLVGLAFVTFGIIAIWSVMETGKQKEVLKAYHTLVRNGEPLNLTQLAESLGMEQEEAKRCLIELSRQEKIPPLKFVDHPEGPGRSAAPRQSPTPSGSPTASPMSASGTAPVYAAQDVQPLVATVRCRSCGATTQIRRGEVVECEHCGNPLTI